MKIALGVTGGIAAYKAAELLRLLQKRGAETQVVMTASAQQFVRPLTFAALSGRKVVTGMFEDYPGANLDSAVEHISVAKWADALLVAPATANALAKFANGLADDFLSTLYLATTAPVILAPAMNVNMWRHPATRKNLETLVDRGALIVAPGSGYLACGDTGEGRMAEPAQIADFVINLLEGKKDLVGERLLITAGPTFEPIDPVRFLGNRSSGKMGYALAEAALARGAEVTLISGPVALAAPAGSRRILVESAAEMSAAIHEHFAEVDSVIMTAAVADFRPSAQEAQKIKRKGPMTLTLEPTEDILAGLGAARAPEQIIIGFAAETQQVKDNALGKLERKGLDAIVVNDVSRAGIGFGSERNAGSILTRAGETVIDECTKREMAERILSQLVELRAARPRKVRS